MEVKTRLEHVVTQAESFTESLQHNIGRMANEDMAVDSSQQQQQQHRTGHLELEGRLGRWDEGTRRFEPGVSRYFMNRALTMLTSFDGWSQVTPWVETQDFYYKCQDGRRVRTTVGFDETSDSLKRTHVVKTTVRKDTFLTSRSCEGDDDMPDLRLSLAVEQPVSEQSLPVMVQPQYVRIKQRKSFYYTPAGFTEAMWVFDLTLSWHGDTKSEAENNQRSSVPKYEIECECLSPLAYRLHKQESKSFVAKSLILKLLDFYNQPTVPPTTPNAQTLFDQLRLAS